MEESVLHTRSACDFTGMPLCLPLKTRNNIYIYITQCVKQTRVKNVYDTPFTLFAKTVGCNAELS